MKNLLNVFDTNIILLVVVVVIVVVAIIIITIITYSMTYNDGQQNHDRFLVNPLIFPFYMNNLQLISQITKHEFKSFLGTHSLRLTSIDAILLFI
jgi:hypothetical protein